MQSKNLKSKKEKVDPLYKKAIQIVSWYSVMSSSLLQRKLNISFEEAEKITEQLEKDGYVSKYDDTSKPRKVLIPKPIKS